MFERKYTNWPPDVRETMTLFRFSGEGARESYRMTSQRGDWRGLGPHQVRSHPTASGVDPALVRRLGHKCLENRMDSHV